MSLVYNALVTDSDARTFLLLVRVSALLIQTNRTASDLIYKRSKEIEHLVLDHYADDKAPGQPGKAYRDRMRTLCFNLNNKKNPGLRLNVVSGEMTVGKFVRLTPKVGRRCAGFSHRLTPLLQEMASQDLQDEMNKLAKQNLWEAQGAQAPSGRNGHV